MTVIGQQSTVLLATRVKKVSYVSYGNTAIQLKHDVISNDGCIKNLALSVTVKEFLKCISI